MEHNNRTIIIQFAIALVGIVFLVRLFFIQVLDESLVKAARDNVIQRKIDYPYRGLIYDRKDKLLVYNSSSFDVYVIPKKLKNLDTLLVSKIFEIDIDECKNRLKAARKYSSVKPSLFAKQLTSEDFARIQDHKSELDGFVFEVRSTRSYPHQSLAHALGYIGEVSEKKLKSLQEKGNTFYRSGDYLGISGIEESYEEVLRGQRGVRYVLVNVRGVEKGSYEDGLFDTISVAGESIYTSIDLELQQYAETLMQGKRGSIVAIEPSTGEILCIVSSPMYDPNLLAGSNLSKNYIALQRDSTKPLFNRPLMGKDAPGSTFKLVNALVGLQEGVLTENTSFPCNQGTVKCHPHPSPQNLIGAIQYSCNPYFVSAFSNILEKEKGDKFQQAAAGLEKWHKHVTTFGLGVKPEVDLPDAKAGLIANNKLYDKFYGKLRWKYSTIYSISIGQGEILLTPLQMANFAATIANRGYYYSPHILRHIGDQGNTLPKFRKKHVTSIDSKHFETIIDGMERAVLGGTGTTAKVKDLTICGKTGTAQNPHGDDHAVFISFAPKEEPKIAVAVFVENAGFGAMTSAPIASLVIQKYLQGEISKERKWWEMKMLGTLPEQKKN
jgi:penicillin-binding protein 2